MFGGEFARIVNMFGAANRNRLQRLKGLILNNEIKQIIINAHELRALKNQAKILNNRISLAFLNE